MESNTADISWYSCIIKDLLNVQTLNVYVLEGNIMHLAPYSSLLISNKFCPALPGPARGGWGVSSAVRILYGTSAVM